MVSLEVMPWFSPAVSPEISRVMHNLGYRTEFWPGDEIGRRFFRRVVFMASGFAAGAVIAPGQHAPLLMTLAGAGSFAVTGSALSIDDNQPRRCWALTRCTTLSVSPEILLRLSEVESAWNKELTSYYVRRCVSERFGQNGVPRGQTGSAVGGADGDEPGRRGAACAREVAGNGRRLGAFAAPAVTKTDRFRDFLFVHDIGSGDSGLVGSGDSSAC